MSHHGSSCMNMMSKSSLDDTSIDSSNTIFLFTFWQKNLNEPTTKVSRSLIYIQLLLAVGVLANGTHEHFCSLTSEYLALIQSWSK